MAINSTIIKKALAKRLIQRKSNYSDKIKLLLAEKTFDEKDSSVAKTSLKKQESYFNSIKPAQILNKSLIEKESGGSRTNALTSIISKLKENFKNRTGTLKNIASSLSKIYKKSPSLKSQKAEVIFGNNFIPEESFEKKKLGFVSTVFLFTTPTLAICFTFFLIFQVNNFQIKTSQPEVKDAFATISSSSSSNSQASTSSNESNQSSPQQASSKPISSDLAVPLIKQIYPLSCEAASLQMALKFYSIDKNQDELLADIGQSQPVKIKNINGNMVWGDPDTGFVGEVQGWVTGLKNGQTSLKNATGWGTSNVNITRVAKIYKPDSYIINNGSVDDLVKALDNQNPVIFWHVRDDFQNKEKIQYYTTTGKIVEFFQNHVNVLKGYKTLPDGTRVFSFVDPYYDAYDISEADMLRFWSKMGNKGVVVK